MNEVVGVERPQAVTLAEESTAFPAVSRPTYAGGLGFHYKWNMGWMHDTLQYMARDPVHRQHHHGEMTFGLVYAFNENFVLPLSHDEVVHGKGSLLDKMPGDRWQQFANLRAYYGFMFGHPGKKLLFMGCEFAQEREWNHDQSLDWHLLDDPHARRRAAPGARPEPAATAARRRCTSSTSCPPASSGSTTTTPTHSVLSFVRRGAGRRHAACWWCATSRRGAARLPRRRAAAGRLPRAAQHRFGALRRQQRRHAAGRGHAQSRWPGTASAHSIVLDPAAAGHGVARMDRLKPRCLLLRRPALAAGRALGRPRRQLRRVLGPRAGASSCACSTPTGTHEIARLPLPGHTRRCLARLPARRRARPGLRPARARPVAARPGPPLQPAQAAARPLCARDRRPLRLARRALRRRPRSTRSTWTRATTRRLRSKARVVHDALRLGRRRAAAHRRWPTPCCTNCTSRASPSCNPACPKPCAAAMPGWRIRRVHRAPEAPGRHRVSLLPVHQHSTKSGWSQHGPAQLLGLQHARLLLRPSPRLAQRRRRQRRRATNSAPWSRPCTPPGIEVMLDVVFNHTAEADEHGPTLSFRGLDNASYYRLPPESPRALREPHRLRQHARHAPARACCSW